MTGKMVSDLYDEAADDPPAWKSFASTLISVLDKTARSVCARNDFVSQCESPIEADLAAAITAYLGHIFDEHGLTLVPQYRFQRYRFDFAIMRRDSVVLFIECDGKDYHSTDEQLANDRRKDAAAATQDIPVLRFSGSEIWRYGDGCAHRVLEHLVARSVV